MSYDGKAGMAGKDQDLYGRERNNLFQTMISANNDVLYLTTISSSVTTRLLTVQTVCCKIILCLSKSSEQEYPGNCHLAMVHRLK